MTPDDQPTLYSVGDGRYFGSRAEVQARILAESLAMQHFPDAVRKIEDAIRKASAEAEAAEREACLRAIEEIYRNYHHTPAMDRAIKAIRARAEAPTPGSDPTTPPPTAG